MAQTHTAIIDHCSTANGPYQDYEAKAVTALVGLGLTEPEIRASMAQGGIGFSGHWMMGHTPEQAALREQQRWAAIARISSKPEGEA